MNGAYVLNNEMTNCGGYATFYCAYATGAIASGNLVESCGSGFAGIDERDFGNVITGNTIRSCVGLGGLAIDAFSGAGTGLVGTRLVITNNIIVDSVVSINQAETVFSGNHIDLLTVNPGDMVKFGTSALRCVIEGNILTSYLPAGSVGFFLQGCHDSRLIGNICRGVRTGASVRGVQRLVAVGNAWSGMTTAVWRFESSGSTDCVIRAEQNNVFDAPVLESIAATRLVYEGLGTNGTSDPASTGDWNGITGRRYDGQMVRWNSGSGERISIFYSGVGWTALN
jgi:hypothetical protein